MVTKEMEAIQILSERLKRHADHLERKRCQDDRRTAKSTHAEVTSIRKNQFDASLSIRELKEAGEQRDKVLLDQLQDMRRAFNQRQAQDHDIAVAALQARNDKARISALITDLHMLIADYDRRSLLQGKPRGSKIMPWTPRLIGACSHKCKTSPRWTPILVTGYG